MVQGIVQIFFKFFFDLIWNGMKCKNKIIFILCAKRNEEENIEQFAIIACNEWSDHKREHNDQWEISFWNTLKNNAKKYEDFIFSKNCIFICQSA